MLMLTVPHPPSILLPFLSWVLNKYSSSVRYPFQSSCFQLSSRLWFERVTEYKLEAPIRWRLLLNLDVNKLRIKRTSKERTNRCKPRRGGTRGRGLIYFIKKIHPDDEILFVIEHLEIFDIDFRQEGWKKMNNRDSLTGIRFMSKIKDHNSRVRLTTRYLIYLSKELDLNNEGHVREMYCSMNQQTNVMSLRISKNFTNVFNLFVIQKRRSFFAFLVF